jgi:hypothetical protein
MALFEMQLLVPQPAAKLSTLRDKVAAIVLVCIASKITFICANIPRGYFEQYDNQVK